MLEHVGSAEQHGGGVGDVPAYRLGERVTGTLAQRPRRTVNQTIAGHMASSDYSIAWASHIVNMEIIDL